MGVQGKGYTKTVWGFEERPVGSDKLNLWDDTIEGSLELVFFLLSQAWGGGDGVVRGATTDDLKITATSPVSGAVDVEAGYAMIDRMPFKLGAQAALPSISAPIGNPRIDLVQAKLDGWVIEVKTGVESGSPVAPGVDAGSIVLAEIYTRVGMTVIKDVDDTVNGYIVDVRGFL